MALLSERQQKAEQLARELGKLDGVWVSSPLPLDDNAKLRIQILDSRKNEVLQLLSDWEWQPVFCGPLPRVTFRGMDAASLYDIDLPRERQSVVNDRVIPGEVSTPGERRKTPEEVLHMRRYLGWTKK
jgi:hypothetical protein